jgi:hypothetical protein
MRRLILSVALVVVLSAGSFAGAAGEQSGHLAHSGPPTSEARPAVVQPSPPRELPGLPILVRPSTLAAQIAELAGHTVRVPYSRVVGVLNPRAFLIDTATRLPPLPGNRARVLVLIEPGPLRVSPAVVVSQTVTVLGVARTLLAMQVAREVPWPPELEPNAIDKLEIRAAVLATSVQTPEGIELTGR